jgi:2-hydroxychromene-2-carboxylate isomerase
MIERETVRRGESVSFYFDPICPWTWITSRWLEEVAGTRRLKVSWRPLSLVVLNNGPEALQMATGGAAAISTSSLRMVEAMRENGRDDLVGPFYTALGTLLHVDGERPDAQLLERAADEAGVSGYLVAAGDDRWDEAVIRSTAEAIELGGPDTGAPILHLAGHKRGFHGPIVSPAPTGEDATRLWDLVTTAMSMPDFFELKHGRERAPQISRQPAGSAAAR